MMYRMNPSQPFTSCEPNAARSNAFVGDLVETDMSMGVAEMLGPKTLFLLALMTT